MTDKPTSPNPQVSQGWEQPRGYFGLSCAHYYRNGKSVCGKHQLQAYHKLAPTLHPETKKACAKCKARSSRAGFGYRGPEPGKLTQLQRQAIDARKRPRFRWGFASQLEGSVPTPAGSRGDNQRSGIVPVSRSRGQSPAIVPVARAAGTKRRRRQSGTKPRPKKKGRR